MSKIIELKNVNKWFDKFQALKDINLEVNQQEKIVICGPSGSGKSTLINLILGLLEVKSGNIKIDGVNLKQSNKVSWRSNIGYVGQKIALINGGVKENIILDKDYDEKKFIGIINKCSLVNFIKKRINDNNLKSNISASIKLNLYFFSISFLTLKQLVPCKLIKYLPSVVSLKL